MELPELTIPIYEFKIETSAGKPRIFDPLRKKYVVLTPEEWVRQNFVQYLVQGLGYPRGLIQIEAAITVYNFSRRCDAVLFDRSLQPRMIIECKAPEVTVNERTFEQIAVYNAALKARYLTVTNGRIHYCCRIDYDHQTYQFLPEIPYYADLETSPGD